MSGKALEKMTDDLPNRKNQQKPWEKITVKQKARKSFSLPRKLRISAPSAGKPLHLQEKVTNYMDASTSTNTSPVNHKTESDKLLESSDNDMGQDDNVFMTDTQTSKDAELAADDDDWETEASVEQMRSSVLPNLDELTIPHPAKFRDADSDSFDLSHQDVGPRTSTPFSPSTKKGFHFTDGQDIPDVSYIKGLGDETDTLKGVDFDLKSISSEKNFQLPDNSEDLIKESQKTRSDSITSSEVPDFDGYEISRDSDQPIEQNLADDYIEVVFDDDRIEVNVDDEYAEQNFDGEDDGATILNKPENTNRQRRKRNDKLGNLSEDVNNCNSKDSFEEGQNMQNDTPKRKGRLYRGVGLKSNSRMDRPARSKHKNEAENSFQDMDECDSEEDGIENVQDIQNDELQVDVLDNNPPKTVIRQKKTNKRVGFGNKTQQGASILSRSRNSEQRRRKHRDKVGNSVEDIYSSFEETQNIQSETRMKKGKLDRGLGIKSNSRIKRPLRGKHKNEGENSFQDMDKSDSGEDGIENVQDIQNDELHADELDNSPESAVRQRKREIYKCVEVDNEPQQDVVNILNGSQISTPLSRKHTNETDNSLKDINNSGTDNGFENVQNIQNEEEMQVDVLDNNPPKTVIRQKKTNKRVGFGNKTRKRTSILSRSRNSTQRRKKHRNKVENSVEDVYTFNSGDSFEEASKVQIDSPMKKGKLYKTVGIKAYSSKNRLKNAANRLNGSKNSTSLEVFEHAQSNQNEAEKQQWPICCLATLEKRKFSILQPVTRDDLPIDEITLISLGKESKKKCKH